MDGSISATELQRLGVPDVGVWRVYGRWSSEQTSIIAAALCATKSGHGFSLRGEPYFVRFEANGELYGAESRLQSATWEAAASDLVQIIRQCL